MAYQNIERSVGRSHICNFKAAYDKCLWNAVLLGMTNQRVCEKCIEVGDGLTSADVICITTKVYNSDRLLSIMKSLGATTTAATAVQYTSKSKLHRVKAKYNKKGPATGNRCSSL